MKDVSENNSDNKKKNKSSSKIYFEEGKNYPIPKKSIVKVTNYKNRVEIKHSWRKSNNLSDFKRHDKDHYIDKRTGELKEYSRDEIFKSPKDIKNAMNRLREIILLNFSGNDNELFITLTCREEVIDIKKIKIYWKYFLRDLKRKYPQCKFEYIYKFERMENGRWHLHVLLKDENHKNLYINNSEIENLWKRGITTTQRVYV